MNTESDTTPSSVDPVLIVRQREVTNRMIEMYLWMIASMMVAGGIFFDVLAQGASILDVISVRYVEFLLAFLTFFFPLIFRLIFGALPLESIRRKRAQRQLETSEQPRESSGGVDIRNAEIRVLSDAMSTDDLASSSATKLFAYYAANSRRLSQSIYCSGLMKPDTHLGDNARPCEVFDDQKTTYIYP